MKLAVDAPPEGTVRDWLDGYRNDAAIAYVFPEGEPSLSWSDVHAHAASIARMITRQGVAKGESIAILHPNGRAAVLCLFAALYGGFRATMINLMAGPEAISYALKHSGARFAFVNQSAQTLLDKVVGPGQITQLESFGPTDDSDVPLHEIEPGDHALLMYTSGTTGRPKGVVHSHASLLAGGWTTAIAHGLTTADRGLCVLPVYHINGLCVTVIGALVSGGSLAVCPRFSASRFWHQAGAAKATWFSVVPTIISHLLHSENDPDPQTKSRLRFGRSASAALARNVQTSFESRFGLPIIETMGLTETAAQILSNPLPPSARKIGSPGVAYGNEIAILGPGFMRAATGEQGEIAVRGPNVMLEYLHDPDATRAAFTPDGWLRTGDLGHQDGDGFVFVTGRLKELIIKGGENIAPREIDEALYSHRDVVEAAAFAAPCDIYGERVEAAVKISDGSQLTSEHLIGICTRRLGKFKSPDVVHILDDLPKGPSGKIQRLKLRALTSSRSDQGLA